MYYSSIGILALIILLIVNNDILIKRGNKDEDPAHHTYRAEPARYVTLAAQIAMFALVSLYAFFVMFRSVGTKHVRYRSIGLSSFAMTGFVIAQSLFPLLPLYATGCLLGSCVLHSFVLESEKEEYRTDLEKQLRDSIYKGSYFDLLTGLPSMTYFFELAEAEKSLIIQKGGSPAFLYIDLNGLKFYNSQYGFSEGDKLLKSFADVLVRHFGNDHSSRVGADHFGVITSADGLEDQLYQIFRENRDLNEGRSLPLRVGIYTDSEGKLPASIACDRAKLACTELNGIYASRFNYYKQELSEDAEKKRYIIEHVDQALTEGWIQVYYQPIVRATNRRYGTFYRILLCRRQR